MKKNTGIVIAEDEKSFVLRFKLILQKVGILIQNFKHFTNSEDAIAYSIQERPGIVFLDLNIKGSPKNGMEILEHLKKQLQDESKIGIISTSNDDSEIEQCKALGGDFYIVKTGKINDFEARMRAFKEHFMDQKSDGFKVFGKDQ